MSIKQRKTLGKPHNIFYYVFVTRVHTHTPLSLSGREVPIFQHPFDGGCRDILPFPTPSWSQQTPATAASTAREVPYKLPLLQGPGHAPGTSHTGKHISCLVTSRCDMEVPRFQVSILTRSHTQSHTPSPGCSPASPKEPWHRGEQPARSLSGLGPASARVRQSRAGLSAAPCVGKGASPAGALPPQLRTPHSPPPHWE